MKKTVSFILAIALCLWTLSVPVAADTPNDSTIPYSVNATEATVELTIDDSGVATVTSICNGISSTTSIHATTYLQRKVLGRWIRVDISSPLDQWDTSVSGRVYFVTKTHQLTSSGTYRAVTAFTITAGTAETITVTAEATF